jgi:hypothetical protein
MKIILTAKEETPKYSAMPPQTPLIDLSFEDFLNFLFNSIILLSKKITALNAVSQLSFDYLLFLTG